MSHHTEWRKLLLDLQGASVREAVRFVSVSQPGAGAFLNAVPKQKEFRLPTWAMRIAVARRLGLPLLAAAAAGDGRRSRHGLVFDVLGATARATSSSCTRCTTPSAGSTAGRCAASRWTTAGTRTTGPT